MLEYSSVIIAFNEMYMLLLIPNNETYEDLAHVRTMLHGMTSFV